jgi:hypothetical protein
MLAGCLRLLLKNLDIRNIATRDVGIVVSINTFKASQIQVKKNAVTTNRMLRSRLVGLFL